MAESEIDYGELLQRALRSVVRVVLERTAREGLPGEHHFYLSLRTDQEGMRLPPFLRQRFPHEITVVLQNQFRDLVVDDAGFSVTLRFDGIPARLVVPWEAVTAFFDPTAEFGLRFDLPALAGGTGAAMGPTAVPASRFGADDAQATPAASTLPAGGEAAERAAEPTAGPAEDDEGGKVLSFGRPRDRHEPE